MNEILYRLLDIALKRGDRVSYLNLKNRIVAANR